MHGESDNQFEIAPLTVVPQKGYFIFSCFGCVVTIIISFLLLVITKAVYVYWSGQSNLENEKNNIESYCLEHYGKKVIIDSINYKNRWSPDAPPVFIAKVHPEDDPELHVEFTRGDYPADPKKLRYNERFLSEYWSKQGLVMLNEYLRRNRINVAKAYFSFDLPDEVKANIKGTTPSLADMIREYKYSMEFTLIVETDEGLNSAVDVEKNAEEILKIWEFLKRHMDIANYEFDYQVYVTNNSAQRLLYSQRFSAQQVRTINSEEEIASYLKKAPRNKI